MCSSTNHLSVRTKTRELWAKTCRPTGLNWSLLSLLCWFIRFGRVLGFWGEFWASEWREKPSCLGWFSIPEAVAFSTFYLQFTFQFLFDHLFTYFLFQAFKFFLEANQKIERLSKKCLKPPKKNSKINFSYFQHFSCKSKHC